MTMNNNSPRRLTIQEHFAALAQPGSRPGGLLARALMRQREAALEQAQADDLERALERQQAEPEYDSRQVGRAMRRAAKKYGRRR